MGLARRAGYALIARSLRRSFRRIEWVGAFEPPPPGVPVVLYANHHVFHDSYVLGVIAERLLRRRVEVWMADLDRFPFFRVLGALPLPPGDAGRRSATIRGTARRMARDPSTLLIYYPEGRLHTADDGLDDVPADRWRRLDRVLPSPKLWWPVALRAAGFHEARPTLQLAGGTPHPRATGGETAELHRLLAFLGAPGDAPRLVLVDGRAGPDERWGLPRRRPPRPA